MPLPADVIVGKLLPVEPSYQGDQVARAFWRLSYRTGRDYVKGQDANAQPILIQHESEDAQGFSRRVRTVKPRNFVGPIIRRYNDFVWRRKPERAGTDPDTVAFLSDVDGHGKDMDTYLKESLLNSEVERESFTLVAGRGIEPDAPAQVTNLATMLSGGVGPALVRYDADAAVWWDDSHSGSLEKVMLITNSDKVKNEDGTTVNKVTVRYYDRDCFVDIECKAVMTRSDGLTVTAIGEEVAHGYGALPVVRLRPVFDPLAGGPGESQAAPIAESQQAILNMLSLRNEELTNVTFTLMAIFGVSETDVGKVVIGSNRLITINNDKAHVEKLGAEPAHAATIQAAIEDETKNLYRQAGLGHDMNGTAKVESGIAKAFKFNDLAATLAALADAVEKAENQIWKLLAKWGMKGEESPTKYADDFNIPEFDEELKALSDALVSQDLPVVIRRKLVDRFAGRNLQLSPEEAEEMEDEMEGWGKPDPMGGAMPGASRTALASIKRPPAEETVLDDETAEETPNEDKE